MNVLWHNLNWPNSQIPEYTCSISHNAPFRTDMCTFLFWMEHCGICNRCILGLRNWSIGMSYCLQWHSCMISQHWHESGNGSVPSGNKALLKSMLSKFMTSFDAMQPQTVKTIHITRIRHFFFTHAHHYCIHDSNHAKAMIIHGVLKKIKTATVYQSMVISHCWYRDHFVYAPSQWETTLQCNIVSH